MQEPSDDTYQQKKDALHSLFWECRENGVKGPSDEDYCTPELLIQVLENIEDHKRRFQEMIDTGGHSLEDCENLFMSNLQSNKEIADGHSLIENTEEFDAYFEGQGELTRLLAQCIHVALLN